MERRGERWVDERTGEEEGGEGRRKRDIEE